MCRWLSRFFLINYISDHKWPVGAPLTSTALRYGSSHWVPLGTQTYPDWNHPFPSLGVCHRVFIQMQSWFFAKPTASMPSSAWDRKAKQLTLYFAIVSCMILSLVISLFKCAKVENPRRLWKDTDLSTENKTLKWQNAPNILFPMAFYGHKNCHKSVVPMPPLPAHLRAGFEKHVTCNTFTQKWQPSQTKPERNDMSHLF